MSDETLDAIMKMMGTFEKDREYGWRFVFNPMWDKMPITCVNKDAIKCCVIDWMKDNKLL